MLTEYIRLLGNGDCLTPIIITFSVLVGILIVIAVVFFIWIYIETGEYCAEELKKWRKLSLLRTK